MIKEMKNAFSLRLFISFHIISTGFQHSYQHKLLLSFRGSDILIVIARLTSGVPEKPLLFGERTNGDARSRHTYRICLPSTADEDDVAIPS